MRTAISFLLSVSVGLPLGAFAFVGPGCAQSNTNPFAGDGGTAAKEAGASATKEGGANPAGGADCAALCAKAAENGTGCEDTDACVSACEAEAEVAKDKDCAFEWQALVDCGAGPGSGSKVPTFTCEDGKISIVNCATKRTAYETCLGVEADGGALACSLKELVGFDPSCNACAQQNCCDLWNTCMNSPACGKLYGCFRTNCSKLTGAAQTQCATDCSSANPTGVSEAQPAVSCISTKCPNICGL